MAESEQENVHTSYHQAMAAQFEIQIVDEDQLYSRQAAEAAFKELDRLEQNLSHYQESSNISRINARGSYEEVKVGSEVMECLKIAAQVNKDTGGAFDITVRRAEEGEPKPVIGMENVELFPEKMSVHLKQSGVKLDLGGIGKGFGVDKIHEFLKDWKLNNMLISASSTILGVGKLPGYEGWPATIGADTETQRKPLEILLKDNALSGSGLRFQGRHILDPDTGRAAQGPSQAWAIAPNAALADALSTAFMVMTTKAVEAYCKAHPDTSAVLLPRPTSPFVKLGKAFEN